MRTLMKRLQNTENPEEATPLLNNVKAYLDRLAVKGVIHKNKAANYKSSLDKHVQSLS